MLSLSDVCHSRYLLYRNLTECGFEPSRASLAVDVLLGHDAEIEELAADFEPSREDWDDYHDFCREVDERMFEARLASDYDDLRDEELRITDYDVTAVLGCAG